MSNAKSYMVTAKQLMRRIRDKVPYSSGDKMMLSNAGSGWMVEGSPPRLLRDYNQLVESYNRGAKYLARGKRFSALAASRLRSIHSLPI